MCYSLLACAFHNKAKPMWLAQRGKDFYLCIAPDSSPLIFPTTQICGVVRRVGFCLCSQLWQGYLPSGVSSLNAPAVTLRTSVSSLYLMLQTLLDWGALKRIYKWQNIATFRWRDIKYWAWIHVWTWLVDVFKYVYVWQSFSSWIKHKT